MSEWLTRVPLVPGIEGDAAGIVVEVNTGLENGGGASVTVDTDPGGGGVALKRSLEAAAGAGSRGGDGDGTGDSVELGAGLDDTGPVGGVGHLGGLVELHVGGVDARLRVALGAALHGVDPLGVASTALLRQARTEGELGGGQQGEGSELHFGSVGGEEEEEATG